MIILAYEHGEWETYLSKRHDIKKIEGVSGVGLGGPEVIAYVEKLTPDIIRALPEEIGGLPVKVKEIGPLVILPLLERLQTTIKSRIQLYRPVPGGVSIGHMLGETGTHGCLVHGPSGLEGISNCHVTGLQWGTMLEGKIGDTILQPGMADYSGPGSEIGYTTNLYSVPEKGSGVVTIDAATYSVSQGLEEVLGIGLPAPSVPMDPGMIVAKSGRTTRLTTAYVETIGAIVDIIGFGEARFENVAITDRGFSAGGDSGSLVVDNWAQSCGLVFAGSDKATVICEAMEIERLLAVRFGLGEPHLLDLTATMGVTMPFSFWAPLLIGGLMCLRSE